MDVEDYEFDPSKMDRFTINGCREPLPLPKRTKLFQQPPIATSRRDYNFSTTQHKTPLGCYKENHNHHISFLTTEGMSHHVVKLNTKSYHSPIIICK